MADDPLLRHARALYAQPPARFIAARNALRNELRGSDRELAERISRLRRAAPSAWAVTRLVAEERGRVDGLLHLGSQLRTAQRELDRESLTELARERRTLVAELVRRATQLLEDGGQRASPAVLTEISGTLEAATADETAGEAVLSGVLVRPLESIGLEPVDLEAALALDELGATTASAAGGAGRVAPVVDLAERRERQRRAKEEREAAAREEAERRAARRAAAEADLERAQARRHSLAAEVADLEESLAAARGELAEADRAVRDAERVLNRLGK